MKRFSERIGVRSPSKLVQLEGMSEELRISLWNVLVQVYESYWMGLARSVAIEILKSPVDEIGNYNYDAHGWLKEKFFESPWYVVYDIMELVPVTRTSYDVDPDVYSKRMQRHINTILERDLSGYRFIQGRLSPISDQIEVAEVEEALSSTSISMRGARTHISSALSLLSQKPEADYRNAIKEAISAVESVCKIIAEQKGGGLKPALAELSKRRPMHNALQEALQKLYGYTSDEDGIRHAILEQERVGYPEAKFMIVACSAFINFMLLLYEPA